MDGQISKIQRYSTRDGPGLRSTVFAIGCPLSCLWCSNPELMGEGEKLLYHRQLCTGCGACVALSHGAIRLEKDGCVIDREACSNLGECADACYYDAYERVGFTVSAEELAVKLLRDKAFYDQSGGGVTFSGGEPASQAGFFIELAGLLKAEGVHVALDTSGYLPWEQLAPLVDEVELVLFDLKAHDSELHRRFTGADNTLIKENIRRAADIGKDMVIRLVIVPGVNDSVGEIAGRLEFVRSLGEGMRVDILKYHRLGAGKYAALGLRDPMGDTPECPDDTAEYASGLAREMGLAAMIGG